MSRFHRSGHWRTNRYGTTYWVSGHTVDRYDWDRYSSYSTPATTPTDATRLAAPSSHAPDGFRSSFTIPNATCPVCGARVFFYQNEHGSRVFFDDLGPPWPKHPCTDNEAPSLSRPSAGDGFAATVGAANRDLSLAEVEIEPSFQDAESTASEIEQPVYTGDGWDRCTVKKQTERDGIAYFTVNNASDPLNKSMRFSTHARPDLPGSRDTLYLKGSRMSFFSFEMFAPQEVEIVWKMSKAASATRKRKARRKRRRG
ncbi:MAG: hypothetical protein SNJ79_00435 [Sphingomonadaceae bacterium]